MKSRESIWRQRAGLLAVAILFLLANVGFLVGARSITTAQREALEEQRAALTHDVAAKEAEAARLEEQRSRLSRVSTVIDEFYGRRVGSRRATLAPIVEEIHAVLKRIGVAPSTITYGTSPIRNLPLSQMAIGFNFNSDYLPAPEEYAQCTAIQGAKLDDAESGCKRPCPLLDNAPRWCFFACECFNRHHSCT